MFLPTHFVSIVINRQNDKNGCATNYFCLLNVHFFSQIFEENIIFINDNLIFHVILIIYTDFYVIKVTKIVCKNTILQRIINICIGLN